MTLSSSPELERSIRQMFGAVERKDLQATLAMFADDAVMADPHYPNPTMRGKAEIEAGLRWGFGSMRQFGFPIEQIYFAQDGHSAAVEVATHHILKVGMHLRFPQMFAVEMHAGKITRLQAYEPYGPHGIAGAVLVITRLVNALQRQRAKSQLNRR
ncbi:nuclear transport factor 2 family protein [Deinococcus psychrotolerans]|uniref:Nuclear transport factor 2 family protein n=1 Tax=Deinococcus psychrotolerans TaxID=2489213 RepID=A0A3G8Y8P9_9DEIO|nr:nuclear transport factor 2 family protein [Deinococcus psychrotolerans]AZI41555.1 nuclear transport factor 2 family protein [Deinococcus psychrotolerans]